MQQPNFIPIPFAENGNKDTIPLTKQTVGRASWNTGFPPETSLPQGAGGYAPMRTDFQGVLYELSAHIFFGQSGNLYAWDATLDYNAWAHVLDTDGNGVTREYIAIAQNGPTTSNVTQPYLDVNYACWKPITLFMTDYVYPVGSIYMTTEATNPGTIFGGTWAKIESKFLVGASATYGVGTTGGNATKALSISEMPAHSHTATTANAGTHNHTATNASNGDHTHTITVNNNGAHTHSVSGTAASNGAHTHGISITNGAQSAGAHTHSVAKAAQTISVNTGSAGAHTHNITINATSMTTENAGAHTHSRGSMNITGSLVGDNEMVQSAKGCFVDEGSVTGRGAGNDDVARKLAFDASKTWSGSTSSNGSHTHSVTFPKTTIASTSAGAHTHSVSITVPAQTLTAASAGAHTHNLSGTSNSGGAHTHTTSGTAASAGSHNHVATNATTGAHTHTITVQNNGQHNHTLTTANTGGGSAFSLIPPYYAVYIWRRTA